MERRIGRVVMGSFLVLLPVLCGGCLVDFSRNLIRIRVPMWLLEKFSDRKSIMESAGEFRHRRWADAGRVNISLEDLKKMGPGVILQVNDRDSRLLLWLK